MVGNYLASIVLHSVEASIHLLVLCVCLTITMKLIKSQRTERKRESGGMRGYEDTKESQKTFSTREK